MIRSWVTECESLMAEWIGPREPEEIEETVAPDQGEYREPAWTPQGIDEREPAWPTNGQAYEDATADTEDVEDVEQGEEVAEDEPEPVADYQEPQGALDEPDVVEPSPPAEDAPLELDDEIEPEELPVSEAEAPAPEVREEAMESVLQSKDLDDTADVAAVLSADSTPEALLQVAQQAMTSGRASEAKHLALRAAALMAQMEVEEASQRVGEAEKRLRQGADLIEQARLDVQQAEQRVNEATAEVAASQQSLGERQAAREGVGHELSAVEAVISDLDEQIRQLMAKRDEEMARAAGMRANLADAAARETGAEAELKAREAAEQEARVKLEDARQRVKTLQRRRGDVEAAMERARENLSRQQVSLGEIEQTLLQVGGRNDETVADEGEELLF